MKRYEVIIAGAGPGGLHCARVLAENGVKVLVLERNRVLGAKTCAGGITWSGLLRKIPEQLLEKRFCRQTVSTRLQNVVISAPHPIVATVNRERLGSHMALEARNAGAEIFNPALLEKIEPDRVWVRRGERRESYGWEHLVGADGSFSRVRASLGLPVCRLGLGICYTVPIPAESMRWHFDTTRFGCGYSWIFPHARELSIGVYASTAARSPRQLERGLRNWLAEQGIPIAGGRCRAQKISYDFRGWNFGRRYLVGDAAGLASPLTGEGIYPAVVSAEAVARTILDPNHEDTGLKRTIGKHQMHLRMVSLAARSATLNLFLAELSAVLLRCRLLRFSQFEMT